VTLRRAPVDLGGVARDAIEAAQPLLAARGHRLAVSLPSSAVRVDADPVRLAQVIVNLLDNAAKYTEPGGQIWLTVAPRDAEAMVQVRDTGMGISEDLLPHIFEPFAQGARTLDRAQGGLGIGLALVRRVVGLHGGRVEARSPGPGQGAEFTVWLPLSTHQATAGTPAAPVADPMGRRLRVLVVDDDTAVTESMVVLLRLEGHEVVSATSGPDALALAAEFHPQAALLDIGLKGMSGYDLARQLRLQAERDQRLLLVAVSGYGHETALTESKAAGFDLHLVKPVPPNELSAVLARHAAQLEAEGTTSAGRDPVR